MKKYSPISKKFPHIIHGADYNPEQWLNYPEIIDEDMRLMKLAGCNAMSIGIFSWAKLEPEEDVYDFSFLDYIMDLFQKNDIKAILATPSGARPAWMSKAHPEVLRVNADRTKNIHGLRHNHCLTSPYYRQKTQKINRLLAERYKDHPSLILWHISNEYGGECHCPLCQDAFRQWLKNKYKGDLDLLNREYWSAFWSHTYTSWEQIESPSPIGETCVHALNLDWKRFITDQTMDFMKSEIAPIREITPDIPVTTNFMGTCPDLNYFKFKDIVDVISWDNYPKWHSMPDDVYIGCHTAFHHDLNRSLKGGKPFMLMESTPSCVNWHEVNKLKRPGMHTLSSLQAVAHGADTVQYFQWRKSCGSSEKFHGAVVDHCGHENTRVFREVSSLGKALSQMDEIIGTYVQSDVAVFYDWENRWAIDDLQGLIKSKKNYLETCINHYYPFWKNGVNVDIVSYDSDFSKYKLIVAPMLYMLKPDTIDKIKNYVQNGGTIVCTYVTGWVNENDLCYLGGFPADGLKDVFGIWAEEIDTLYEHDQIIVDAENSKGYKAIDYCELVHVNTATVLAEYKSDFYIGLPAVTCNKYGSGNAYYIAFRDKGDFTVDFYEYLISDLHLKRSIDTVLPYGVTAHTRQDGENTFIFLENFNNHTENISLPDKNYKELYSGKHLTKSITLDAYETKIVIKKED